MGAVFLGLWILQSAIDPCVPIDDGQTVAVADPSLAEIYRSIGDGEQTSGQDETAAMAYREALRLDTKNPGARTGLRRLCEEQKRNPDSQMEEGLRLAKAQNHAQAIAYFERARQGGTASAAALMEGICYFEIGNDDHARPLLEEAEANLELRATAQLFLGLLKLRQGDSTRAKDLFVATQSDASLGSLAAELARVAYKNGRLTFSSFVNGGYDSNVDLTPDGTRLSNGPADAVAEATGALLYRPLGASGPFVRANAMYRNLFRYNQFDLGNVGGSLGWQLGNNSRYARLEYGYDFLTLGNSPYLSAHRISGDGRYSFGVISSGLSYSVRLENYLSLTAAAYSGHHQDAAADVAWNIAPRMRLAAIYRVGRDAVEVSELSWLEQGPAVQFRLGIGSALRFSVEGGYTYRLYDALDANLELQRADGYWDGTFGGEFDVTQGLSVRVSLGIRKAQSNVTDFNYTKVTTALGVSYALGVL